MVGVVGVFRGVTFDGFFRDRCARCGCGGYVYGKNP